LGTSKTLDLHITVAIVFALKVEYLHNAIAFGSPYKAEHLLFAVVVRGPVKSRVAYLYISVALRGSFEGRVLNCDVVRKIL